MTNKKRKLIVIEKSKTYTRSLNMTTKLIIKPNDRKEIVAIKSGFFLFHEKGFQSIFIFLMALIWKIINNSGKIPI